ncbi:Hypothetical protein GLP15_4397 [Giardia lamblia P15]|uniref:Uncharacterized protein n=1 Tax=Giardia intestinalis (strain P15) TaxID=658858 RepID=E1F354_GIAIA|nr:Hypothetical protein GLP15_4397 [Giardia lamblia P15]
MSQRKLQRTRPLLKPANKDLGLADANQLTQRAVSSKTRSSSNSRATSASRTGSHRASTASHSAAKSRNSVQSAKGPAQEKDFIKPIKSAKAPTSIADRPAFNLDLGGPPASSHSRTGLRAPAKSSINVHAYTTKERAELFARSRATQNVKKPRESSTPSHHKPSVANAYKAKAYVNATLDDNTTFSDHSFIGRSSSNISHSNPFRSHSEQARSMLSASDLTSSVGSGSSGTIRSTSKTTDMSMQNKDIRAAINAVTDITYKSGLDLATFDDKSFDNYSTARKLKSAKTKEEQQKIRQHQISELIGDMAHYKARIASPADIRSPFTKFGTTKQTAAIKAATSALEKVINPKQPAFIDPRPHKASKYSERSSSCIVETEQKQYPVKCSLCGLFLGMATDAIDQGPTYCAQCAEQMRANLNPEKKPLQYKMLISPGTINKHKAPMPTTASSPTIVETMVVTQGKSPPPPEPLTKTQAPMSPPIYSVQNVPRKPGAKQLQIIGTSGDAPLITSVAGDFQPTFQPPISEKWEPLNTVQHLPQQNLQTVVQVVDKEDPIRRNLVSAPFDECSIVPAVPIDTVSKPKDDGSESVAINTKPITRNVGISHLEKNTQAHKHTPTPLQRLSDEEIEDLIIQRITELHKSVHHRPSSVCAMSTPDTYSSSVTSCSSSREEEDIDNHRGRSHQRARRHQSRKHKHRHHRHSRDKDKEYQRIAYKNGEQIVLEKVKCPCCDDIIEMRILNDCTDGLPSHKEKHTHRKKRSHKSHQCYIDEQNAMNMQACLSLLTKQIHDVRSKSAGRLGQPISEPTNTIAAEDARRRDRLALLQRLDDRLAGIQAMSGALSLGARCSSVGNQHVHSAYTVLESEQNLTSLNVGDGEHRAAVNGERTSAASAYGLDNLFELQMPETCQIGY